MELISPGQFKTAFLAVASNAEPQLLQNWTSRKAYTSLIRQTLLPAIANELGLTPYCQRDYYWLDAVFCQDFDTARFGPGSQYAKCLQVALEHENDFRDCKKEVNKLQLFNVPLKVLITYAPPVRQDGLLKEWAEIILDADLFGDFGSARRQLVVFGDKDQGRVQWTFHVYRNGAFEPL